MKRFSAFQGLRTIAFALIFFSHSCGFLNMASGGIGAVGVEIFIVLSGFLVEYHFKDSGLPVVRQSAAYAKKKLVKFYWLHILTMILALARIILGWAVDGFSLQNAKELGLKIASNLLLVQSWIPDRNFYFSLNAVAWYLSTSMLMYFCAPLLHRWINKLSAAKMKCFLILAIYLIQLVVAYQMRASEYLHAVIYIHPMVRIFDFAVGMLLGSVYKQKTKPMPKQWGSILEIAAILYLAAVVNLFAKVPEAFCYVALSAPMAWVLIYVFAFEQGVISGVLSIKPMISLGNISLELFMIHLLVIRYWGYIRWIFRTILYRDIDGRISILCTAAISVFAAWILHGIGTKLHNRRSVKI